MVIEMKGIQGNNEKKEGVNNGNVVYTDLLLSFRISVWSCFYLSSQQQIAL